MFDIVGFISVMLRFAILEVPVFLAIRFIFRNFVGIVRFILILVLCPLVYGLFICLGMFLGIFFSAMDPIYLPENFDYASMLARGLLIAGLTGLGLIPAICIIFRSKDAE